jgi:hypothetical protein
MRFGALAVAHLGVAFNIAAVGEFEGWFSSSLLGGLTPIALAFMGAVAFVVAFSIEANLFSSSDSPSQLDGPFYYMAPHFSDAIAMAGHFQEASERLQTATSRLSAKTPCAYCGTTKGYGEFNTCLSCGAPKP